MAEAIQQRIQPQHEFIHMVGQDTKLLRVGPNRVYAGIDPLWNAGYPRDIYGDYRTGVFKEYEKVSLLNEQDDVIGLIFYLGSFSLGLLRGASGELVKSKAKADIERARAFSDAMKEKYLSYGIEKMFKDGEEQAKKEAREMEQMSRGMTAAEAGPITRKEYDELKAENDFFGMVAEDYLLNKAYTQLMKKA